MTIPGKSVRKTGAERGRRVAASRDLHPMLAVKLWSNPCWLSFRANFIAHHFNQPIYDWIERDYRLTPPEHMVLYALALREGITADDIAACTSRPKNTLSRGVNGLLRRGLIVRSPDTRDRRRLILRMTRRGRDVVRRTVPTLVAHETRMFSVLSPSERRHLQTLLDKIIVHQKNWPTRIEGRP